MGKEDNFNGAKSFHSLYIKSKGCWGWKGGTSNGRAYYRMTPAYRIMWEEVHGDPGDLFVCHSCDNPMCVNPDHLFLGTQSDNMKDCAKKKRISLNNAKLSWADVGRIRESLLFEARYSDLASLYNVDVSQISSIKTERTWRI